MKSRARRGASAIFNGYNTMNHRSISNDDNGFNFRSSEEGPSFYQRQPPHYTDYMARPQHNKRKAPPSKEGEPSTPQMKGLSCTKCKRFYDLKSKCALLLKCGHSVCEECLLNKVDNGCISFPCLECNHISRVSSIGKGEFNIREHFPINYYMAGRVYFARAPCNSEIGLATRFVRNDRMVLSSALEDSAWASIVSSIDHQKCDNNCAKTADVRCVDCSVNLCKSCWLQVHGDAASEEMKKHFIWPFTISNCSAHNIPNEFYCFLCNEYFCACCILNAHASHSYKKVTELQDNTLVEFKALADNSKEVLGKLQGTLGIVNRHISNTSMQPIKPEFSRKLFRAFQYLFGKVQQIESRLIAQATAVSNLELTSLLRIRNVLESDIKALQKLIAKAEDVLNKKNFNAPQNVGVITLQMAKAKSLPCNLHIRNTCDNNTEINLDFTKIISDLDCALMLNISENSIYQLTSEKGEEQTDVEMISSGPESNTPVYIQNDDQVHDLESPPRKPSGDYTPPTGTSEVHSPIQFRPSQEENVRLLHFVTPRLFYVFPIKHNEQFAKLNADIKSAMRGSIDSVDKVSVAQMYLVKYHKQPIWRRGIVSSVNMESKECKVHLLDYGLSAILSFEFLYAIPQHLVTFPPFAMECCLVDVAEPEGKPWTDDIATEIMSMLDTSNITINTVNILPGNVLECDLKVFAKHQDFSLREALIATGRVVSSDPVLDLSLNEISFNSRVEDGQAFPNETLDLNGSFIIRLLSVVDATTVLVQTCPVDVFAHLQFSLNNYYRKHADECEIYSPRVNMPVAVKMSYSNSISNWHRAVITSINPPLESIRILMADSGAEIFVSYDSIRRLDPKFLALPKIATKVNLIDVSFENEVQNEMGKSLLAKLQHSILKMTVHDFNELPQVTLYKKQNNYCRCVNAHLVSIGLKSTGDLSLTLEWPHNDDDTGESGANDQFTKSLLSQAQGNSESDFMENEEDLIGIRFDKVRVLNVQDPHSIYVHFVENIKLMNIHKDLSLNLQLHYKTHPLLMHSEWRVNEVAVAFNQKTKRYYRVVIVMKKSEDLYEVRGLDYGNVFTAKLDNIGECMLEFSSYPPIALRVLLYGTSPFGPNWSLTATDFVNDLVLDKPNTYITKLKTDPQSSDAVPVLMWTKETESVHALKKRKVRTLCVNKLLCQNGLGRLAKEFALPKPMIASLGEEDSSASKNVTTIRGADENTKNKWLPALRLSGLRLQGVVTYIGDDGSIFFNEISDRSEVQMIEDTLAKKFSGFMPDASIKWKVGDVCTVRYHRNNNWYRGELVGIERRASTEYRVRLIDYGSTEQVEYDEISPEVLFLDRPILCKAIRLWNLCIPDGFTQKVIDTLHVVLVDKVIDIHCTKGIQGSDTCPEAIVYAGRDNINLFVQNQFNRVLNIDGMRTFPPPPHQVDVDSQGKDVLLYPNSSVGLEHFALPHENVFPVRIINILSLDQIAFIVDMPGYIDNVAYKTMQTNINANWRSQLIIANLKMGDPCICRWNDQWYRARILCIMDTILVYFVDLGIIRPVRRQDIRQIRPEWLMGSKCSHFVARLFNFEPITDNHLIIRAIRKHLEAYAFTTKIAKTISRNPLTIELFDSCSAKLAYQELIDGHVIKSYALYN